MPSPGSDPWSAAARADTTPQRQRELNEWRKADKDRAKARREAERAQEGTK